MFQKLLKHEFAVNRGLFTILSLSALGAGAIGGVVIQILIRMFQEESNIVATDMESALQVVGVMLLMMLAIVIFIAIAGYITFVTIMLIYRFYKRHFTDEGYLTFTLPATTHQILLSSIVNILIWSLITTLVALAAYALMLVPVFILADSQSGVNIFAEMQSAMTMVYGKGFFAWWSIMLLSSIIGSTILPLLAITIGAQVAKKHKLLAGFGIYYGLNIGISFVTGIFSMITILGDAAIMNAGGTMILTFLFPSLLYFAIGIGGYFLMHYMVKNRLNLP